MVSKRTILITGCSDGSLGSALALAFHKAGWRVFASARNMSKLKKVEAAGIETVQLDINSDGSIATSVSRIEELTGGSLDALLNNAGAGYSMPLIDLDIAKAQELFELNAFSLLRVTRLFLPLLLKSTHGGMIVNNTSCSSTISGGLPFAGAYNASKAAAASFTEVLRLELAPFGIKVINLMTGAVLSTFHDNAPKITLPSTSLYNVAKDVVEKTMKGGDASANGTDPIIWAERVVKKLSRRNPTHWIWEGTYSTMAWMATFLPVGFMDGYVKKLVGLDLIEQKIKEQGGASKFKPS